MTKYCKIDNLSEKEIFNLYNEIIEDNEQFYAGMGCKWAFKCSNGNYGVSQALWNCANDCNSSNTASNGTNSINSQAAYEACGNNMPAIGSCGCNKICYF